MNLLYKIKQKLEHTNHNELLRSMGYHNLNIGNKTLQEFLVTDDIYLFLKNGSFDFKYNSEEFLKKLIEALDLTSTSDEEIYQHTRRLEAINTMRNTPYIYVDTCFKRKSEPIFVLAILEGRRHIYIDKELLVFKSEKEILARIGNIVENHYALSNRKLQVWGEIYNYVYHHTDGSKYNFNPDGTLSVNQDVISEGKTVLNIGKHELSSIINISM